MADSPTGSDSIESPVGEDEFARLMAAFAPFEARPLLAVAVSGGGDSMALCRLADGWARKRGGAVAGLTVDHGLRPESLREATQVAAWLADAGIRHRVLRWEGPKPGSRIQAAARDARYRLLRGWCRDEGVLHLLTAHTRDDQAETVVMRGERGSAETGLAGMSACVALPEARLLRPFLAIGRERLRATLREFRQPWIEDPSNRNPHYTRVRVRERLEGEPGRIGALAEDSLCRGRVRADIEDEIAHLAATACQLRPQGYAVLRLAPLASAGREAGTGFLSAVLRSLGGRAYPPERRAVGGLADRLGRSEAGSWTLGGCRIVATAGKALVCREARGLPAPFPLEAGQTIFWDGRFRIAVADRIAGGAVLGPLGRDGWAEIASAFRSRGQDAPRNACLALPALRDERGVAEVPGLGYRRDEQAMPTLRRIVFAPRNAIAGDRFCLASGISSIMSLSGARAGM